MEMPNFDNTSWGSGEALLAIFFSQEELVWENLKLRNAIRKQLRTALNVNNKNASKFNVASELDTKLDMLVQIIKAQSYVVNSDSIFAPMVWLKIGMELSCANLPISSKFQDSYCDWRENHLEQGLLVQVGRTSKRKMRKGTKSKNRPSFPLDVFLVNDLSEVIKYNWNTQYAKYGKKEIKFGSLKSIKTGPARPARDARQQVGPQALSKFQSYINKAAKSGSIKFGKKVGNKYTYRGTRQNLIDALKKQFPTKLNRKNDSYLNLISATVSCKK